MGFYICIIYYSVYDNFRNCANQYNFREVREVTFIYLWSSNVAKKAGGEESKIEQKVTKSSH